MSVNPLQSWVNTTSPLFLLVNASTINADSINAKYLQTLAISTGSLIVDDIDIGGQINVSTINASGKIDANEFSSVNLYTAQGTVSTLLTQHIVLDQATLDVVGGNVLLLNGIPIATTANLSSIQDWSYFPAVSSVNMSGCNINNLGNLNSQNIFNALNVQTDTLSALTSATAPSGNFTTLRGSNFSTVNTNTSNLFVQSNLTASNISTTNLSVGGQPYISGGNWSLYPAFTTVNMAGNTLSGGSNFQITTSNLSIVASNQLSNTCKDFSVVADEGINIASVSGINLTAQNGTYGSIALTANGGFNNGVNGVINLTANGGQVGGVGQGGSINLTANTPLGFSNLTSKISLNASGINSYAGSIPPLASAYGYNFMYGQNGCYIASGLPPGLPNTVGTTYIYGTTGIEMPSQAYMSGIEPYWDGLTTPPPLNITGRFIVPNVAQVSVNLSNVQNLDFESSKATRITNIDSISMSAPGALSNVQTISMNSGAITGVNTINGASYPPTIPVANIVSTFATASISSLTVSTINNPVKIPNMRDVSTILGTGMLISSFSSITGGSRLGGNNYTRVIEYDYNPPTSQGGAEFCVSAKAQNAGAVVSGSLGVDLVQGASYIQSVWDNYISMPLNFYGANFSFQSDNDYCLFIDGQAGAPTTLSTGFTFYQASTITQKNQHLTAGVRQPFIQYGKVATSGASGNTGTLTLSTSYANANWVGQVSMEDTNPAQLSFDVLTSNTFNLYWANGGAGSHTLSWTTFGDI